MCVWKPWLVGCYSSFECAIGHAFLMQSSFSRSHHDGYEMCKWIVLYSISHQGTHAIVQGDQRDVSCGSCVTRWHDTMSLEIHTFSLVPIYQSYTHECAQCQVVRHEGTCKASRVSSRLKCRGSKLLCRKQGENNCWIRGRWERSIHRDLLPYTHTERE